MVLLAKQELASTRGGYAGNSVLYLLFHIGELLA